MTIIRVLDFESSTDSPETGSVIEVGYCDLHLEAKSVQHPVSYFCGAPSIPPETRAVHHIQMHMIDGKPAFDGNTLNEKAEKDGVAAWAAHSAKFELLWFSPAKPMICTYKSALRAWPDAPVHNNQGLRYWLEDQCLVEINYALVSPPHRAGPDAYVTANILLAMFNAGHTGKEMIAWSKQPAMLPKCPIGEHRGKLWKDVDFGFLEWMVNKDGMDEELKFNARAEMKRRTTRV